MIEFDRAKAAFIVDDKGALNKVSVDLIRELTVYNALDIHSIEIICTQEINSCKLTLDNMFKYEINVEDPIIDGADVIINQCYFPETPSQELISKAFSEDGLIIFGKVKH